MAARIAFSEDFLGALGNAKQDMDQVLVAFIHVLESSAVPEDRKALFRDRAVALGNATRDAFRAVRLESVNASNAGEMENVITARLKALRADVLSFLSDAERAGAPQGQRGELFSIQDVAAKLGSARINSDLALGQDKIENLFAVKDFIIRLYESQTAPREEGNPSVERELLKVKERAFLDAIRGAQATNPEYFFRSVEIIKKLVRDGKKPMLREEEGNAADQDAILFSARGEQEMEVDYGSGELRLSILAGKAPLGGSVGYSIQGLVEKGGSRVEYRIETTIGKDYVAQKERLMGLDYLWSQFDRVYLEAQGRREAGRRRQEEEARAAVDKAMDDILF